MKVTLKTRVLKETFPKLVSQVSAANVKVMCVTANCPSPFKIDNDGVSIEAPKPDSIISLKVTPVIKE